ncbi:MAG TPA: sugar phosphate isomerase/epimerase family protein [Candidatus Saccharimonadales bacterium]|nr:sugar phosphate isomerase/epimerase family protein [Candidatus Saccharimonadales bacterium]
MYSLSSCWNSHRHNDGRAMLREIRDMGFEYAELSHGIRISLLPGVFQAVDAGEIKISSLHNFCPLPMGVNHAAPNIFKFTSDNPRERENALKHTLKTIETAARLKAGLVVLHMGAVEMKDYTDKLVEMVGEKKKETPKFEKLLEEAMVRREEKKEQAMANAYEVLHKLVAAAEPHGIKLGIENREAIEEIPFESDYQFFFMEFKSPSVVYWHDTGHAQIKENLGLIHHLFHLESLKDRLYGFHVHDVEFPGRDHRAPGSGMIDFKSLKQVVKPEHVKVFEFSPSLTPEQVKSGVAHIKSIWGPE